MTPYYSEKGIEIYLGDNREVLPHLSGIDTVLTDPPYGIGFMGKGWDSFKPENVKEHTKTRAGTVSPSISSDGWTAGAYDRSLTGNQGFQKWCKEWAKLALAACKPGAMMLCFGGTRTQHRMISGIEDAGWEIRDCLMWLYGSGFPKSHNLKEEWSGWGTALKPAWEPIVLAMKPLDGTFVQNAKKYGVAGLNIDGGRIATRAKSFDDHRQDKIQQNAYGKFSISDYDGAKGRWPANLLLDEESAEMLDNESPENTSKPSPDHSTITHGSQLNDRGGVSRFFYIAKADNKDRGNQDEIDMPLFSTKKEAFKSIHPTVKPLELMERLIILQTYLLKLTSTPSGGIVLDPFMGSGTTLVAAKRLGRSAIGIEKEKAYIKIAIERLKLTATPLAKI